MKVQSTTTSPHVMLPSRLSRHQQPASEPEQAGETVRISQAARQALEVHSASVEQDAIASRLAEIRAKGPVNRSQEEHDFLLAADKRLAEILAQGKVVDNLSSEELAYVQTASGFVNTMATLSSAERAMYDEAVASGNADAAKGIALLALIRAAGPVAGGAGGSTYDPFSKEISAANVEQYFRHSIVDSDGEANNAFQALIRYLKEQP